MDCLSTAWRCVALVWLGWAALSVQAADLVKSEPVDEAPVLVQIVTNLGDMTFVLHRKQAPKTTARFIELAKNHWYEGKAFYRVVAGHVIQAGLNDDNHPDMQKYQVPAEFSAELPQIRGSLGLARGDDPDSGSTEFYICLERRPHLDGKYTNFGQLMQGEEVLTRISEVPVQEHWLDNPGGKPIAFHQPVTPVVIQKINVIE